MERRDSRFSSRITPVPQTLQVFLNTFMPQHPPDLLPEPLGPSLIPQCFLARRSEGAVRSFQQRWSWRQVLGTAGQSGDQGLWAPRHLDTHAHTQICMHEHIRQDAHTHIPSIPFAVTPTEPHTVWVRGYFGVYTDRHQITSLVILAILHHLLREALAPIHSLEEAGSGFGGLHPPDKKVTQELGSANTC